MQQLASEMQVDNREVTHGVIVEQRLMELAGIRTEQTNAQFRRNTCYATDFKLRFANAEELRQFVQYYQERTPGLILATTYRADALSTISMDTTKLYTFAGELRPETSVVVPGC